MARYEGLERKIMTNVALNPRYSARVATLPDNKLSKEEQHAKRLLEKNRIKAGGARYRTKYFLCPGIPGSERKDG